MINTKKCLICNGGRKNDTLYWHLDPETSDIWCWCNKCGRGYSIYSYCHQAGISLNEFLKGDFDFIESKSNEVTKMEWPSTFITLSDPRAKEGVEYIKSRGLTLDGDMYYDVERKGIVFPYYVNNVFVGAQTRLLQPFLDKDGELRKIDTMYGTRLGLVFGLWNQDKFFTDIKIVGVCEGYFNALALQQAFNCLYGGIVNNPWKFICTSGAGITNHQKETLKELKEQGIKIVSALDSDEAGLKGLIKLKDAEAITHYALTSDNTKDWNDLLQQYGHKRLAEWFIRHMKDV
jgi:hypothetical protein